TLTYGGGTKSYIDLCNKVAAGSSQPLVRGGSDTISVQGIQWSCNSNLNIPGGDYTGVELYAQGWSGSATYTYTLLGNITHAGSIFAGHNGTGVLILDISNKTVTIDGNGVSDGPVINGGASASNHTRALGLGYASSRVGAITATTATVSITSGAEQSIGIYQNSYISFGSGTWTLNFGYVNTS